MPLETLHKELKEVGGRVCSIAFRPCAESGQHETDVDVVLGFKEELGVEDRRKITSIWMLFSEKVCTWGSLKQVVENRIPESWCLHSKSRVSKEK